MRPPTPPSPPSSSSPSTWIPTVCEAITEDELDTLTKDAMADACFPGNPREATYDDVMGMFRQIMK